MTAASIVVIGHVDHGKTSLVHALTGIETDCLTEEKKRGLSITAGYAHQSYAAGTLDFIDAPGHADFVSAMIAGASGAQAALIVVSALEGLGAQTHEHLRIAGLLGIKTGVIAVTKCDMLDAAKLADCCKSIGSALADTAFGDASMIGCSARSGQGVTALHAALAEIIACPPQVAGPLHSFLPVDRTFSLPGRGTIVTGTLQGQALDADSNVMLMPTGQRVSIRALHARGRAQSTGQVGARTAVNLRGVSVDEIKRGTVLCEVGSAAPTTCMDVYVTLLNESSKPIKHNDELRVHLGTASEVARIRLFGGGQMLSGSAGFAQLRFNKPTVGFAGQQAVLRRLSPAETIGGVEILDPQSSPTRARDQKRLQVLQAAYNADVHAIALSLAKAQGGVAEVALLARLSRSGTDAVENALRTSFREVAAGLLSPTAMIDDCTRRMLEILTCYHAKHPLHIAAPHKAIRDGSFVPALWEHTEQILAARGEITAYGQRVALSSHAPLALLSLEQREGLEKIEADVLAAALAPPTMTALAQTEQNRDLLALSLDLERLCALPNIALNQVLILHPDILAIAADTLHAAFPSGQPFSTSAARVALATSRRVIVPVLEYFDAQGVTCRIGDARRMADAISVPPSPPS